MLQRSVTEIRRLPSGRPKLSANARSDMSRLAGRSTGGIDPHLAPVAAQLLLPDGNPALDLLDGVTARLERLGSMRCRRERSEEHTSELQSPYDLVCRLLLEKKKSHIP